MAPNPEFPSIAWAGPASSGRSRAGLGPYRYITWHATANPTASPYGEATFARNRTDGVGMHAVADASVCLQTQVTSLSVGHVGSGTGNRYGISIELCGVNADSAEHWRPIINQAAPFARLVMAKYGIANRWLTIEQMRDGRSTGHITHDMARLAWGSTDHTDPGPNFPKDHVLAAIMGRPVTLSAQTGEDDQMNALMRYANDPSGAVFLTDGKTARWVKTEAEILDRVTLHNDGTLRLGNNGVVRVVGRRSLIGAIIGDVPPWWVDGVEGIPHPTA